MVWRRFIEPGQTSPRDICCSVFRRERRCCLASVMILYAERYAWSRWPGERLYSYVAPWMVRSSIPDWCFQVAGWRKCRNMSRGLVELGKLPVA